MRVYIRDPDENDAMWGVIHPRVSRVEGGGGDWKKQNALTGPTTAYTSEVGLLKTLSLVRIHRI